MLCFFQVVRSYNLKMNLVIFMCSWMTVNCAVMVTIVEKNTLVLGQCYEEYMADIQKNDSMGKTTHVEKVAVNAEVKGQEEVNNNNDDKGKIFA